MEAVLDSFRNLSKLHPRT